MINGIEILASVKIIKDHHVDIRTVTMGISLLDCISESANRTAEKVYDKICHSAGKLVSVSDEIADMYGIPIVNKRVSVTPIAIVGASSMGFEKIALAMDSAAEAIGIDFIGGYSALVQKGTTDPEREFLKGIPEVLAETKKVCSSVNVASTRAGINMAAVAEAGRIMKRAAYLTRDKDGIGAAKFVAFANAVEDNPFMAGAFHGTGEADRVINVGVSGPGVVKTALESIPNGDLSEVGEVIKRTAVKITRVGQLVARKAAEMLDANFGIVDLSLAPTPAVGDSVARILEEIGLEQVGAHGTTAALMLLNDAVKKGGIMASQHVGGLSGAFIPVSEDEGMIAAAQSGALHIEKLEAMTAVCSVGLDMIAVPGDTPEEVLSAILADEAAIGVVNNKTTAVRLIPVYGKGVGERAEFGGLLGSAPIMAVNPLSPAKLISRGGRIAAPVHGNKN